MSTPIDWVDFAAFFVARRYCDDDGNIKKLPGLSEEETAELLHRIDATPLNEIGFIPDYAKQKKPT